MGLVYISIAFVVGIYFGSRLELPLAVALPLIFGFLLVALLWRRERILLWGGLCLAIFLCGALRFQAVPTGDELQPYIGQGMVEIVGVVAEEPEPQDSSASLRLSAREINADGEWREVSGVALVRTTRFPVYHYGDMLQVTGELEEPSQPEDFDYRAYLAREGIYTTIYYPEIEFMEGGHGPQPLQSLYDFRSRMAESLEDCVSEPQSSVAQAVVLGIRSDISSSVNEDFRKSGTAHILAISGLNMTIVAGILLSISTSLFGRQRPTYFLVTLSTLWAYALLAGMAPSVVRAAIMASLFLLAAYLGRQRSVMTALAFAAAIMVAIAPQVLWQVSFQLSFAAVAGLVLLAPIFQRWGARTKAPNVIVDSISVSLAAILATLPLIAHYFGYVSLVGLPATFLALPALPAIIVLSALVGVVGIFAQAVAQVIGWAAWLFLGYMTGVVGLFADLPYSSWEVGGMDARLVWLYYGLFLAVLWLGSRRERGFSSIGSLAKGAGGRLTSIGRRLPARWVIYPLLVIAILVWVAVIIAPSGGKLAVSFLDVGQGDAILITTPSNQRILVDGGPSPEQITHELGEELPFWEKNIDLVVLTHAHDDHITGLVEVLRRYHVGQVIEPCFLSTSPAYTQWQDIIAEKGIKCTCAQAGQQIDLGDGAMMDVLSPPQELLEDTDSDIDNNGVVLRLSMGDVSFLLTADIYADGERYLLDQGMELRSTVLKVAHHGGDTSTTSTFLAAVVPQVAVISVVKDSPFGHPSKEVVARLEERLDKYRLYRTSEDGTITFTTDGERLWVETER